PDLDFKVTYNKKSGQLEVFTEKEVMQTVADDDYEISTKKVKTLHPSAELGDMVWVPFEAGIGRIEILAAKQLISTKIRDLEFLAVYNDNKDRQGTIVTGLVHKRERAGWVIKMGEVLGLLPKENVVDIDSIRVGHQIKVLLKEVLPTVRGDNYQLIFDRVSSDFVQKLLEMEIPEIFEGMVEIKKIVRIAGYKTKAIVASNSKEIDPVGTCVGVGGSRIKPILRELGQEKVDLIEWTDAVEDLVRDCLKPAEVDKVIIDNNKAVVLLAEDQRSYAIGKMGQNILLASKLSGMEIQLQDLAQTSSGDPEESGIEKDHVA
ncbi:transcription termination factor NusA, partial [Candidatus Dependentiae bacterium]|nr:transcription termination factor NusA [Candidatus Dependentiae bacterium]